MDNELMKQIQSNTNCLGSYLNACAHIDVAIDYILFCIIVPD